MFLSSLRVLPSIIERFSRVRAPGHGVAPGACVATVVGYSSGKTSVGARTPAGTGRRAQVCANTRMGSCLKIPVRLVSVLAGLCTDAHALVSSACVRACVCVCARARACVRARVRVCVRRLGSCDIRAWIRKPH